jgi:hypothetical protein
MAKRQSKRGKRRVPKTVLWLPDLDKAKSAILNSLSSTDAQREYRHGIDEFVEWHCRNRGSRSARLSSSVYRIHLESRHLAPGTINLRLGAVRRLADEASDRMCNFPQDDLIRGRKALPGGEHRPAPRRR